jgi:uncharacterized protein (TIGR02246 family)
MRGFAEVAEQIRHLIATHAQAQDAGRADELAELYCPDGAFEVPGMGFYEGSATIRETWKAWTPKNEQRHIVTNTVITEWSDREAKASSDAILLQHGEQGWTVSVVARYHDTFRNTDAGWRIWRRHEEFFGWTPPGS